MAAQIDCKHQKKHAKTEIDRLQSRQAAAENRVERLKGLLKYFMETRGLRSMKGRLNTILGCLHSRFKATLNPLLIIPERP